MQPYDSTAGVLMHVFCCIWFFQTMGQVTKTCRRKQMIDKIHKLTPSVIHWIYICNYVMHGNWKILGYSHLFIFLEQRQTRAD